MDKNFGSQTAGYELSLNEDNDHAVIKQGNDQDRLDMERLGQRQQLSVRRLCKRSAMYH
jgi:hypothetical protein